MPYSNNLCYEFGPYRLDLNKRVLSRSGEIISLTPKATEILVLLVVNAGQLVEKDELLKEVWPDTFVEESNLTQNIFTLRRALGDDRAGPKFIETVARRGYRFVAAVRVVDGDESHPEAQGHLAEGIGASAQPVVAVLPILNTTGDGELEYLAEGLTDNIINNLSRVSKLRVMSRSAVFRYRTTAVDPREVGRELGVTAVMVGTINSRPSGVAISVELVEVSTGWQLWGENFDSDPRDILEIQDTITRELLAALKLKLTGDEEKGVTARYTENAEAYEAYLEGRYHWSRYTKKGIEKAIGHFRHAIELDPNYALAYAGIVDCYLRLATNYLPPEEDVRRQESQTSQPGETDPRVRIRFEWDRGAAERELRRANELKAEYPSTHQWIAAYRFSLGVLKSCSQKNVDFAVKLDDLPVKGIQLMWVSLTANEEVQILCAIAREQLEVGNYDAGCLMLQKRWTPGEWPNLDSLSSPWAADLLFTAGSLAGCLSSTGRIRKGQRHAEVLLSASIGIFEQLGAKRRSAEARIELGLSYYRQGNFDFARNVLLEVLEKLPPTDPDLRSLALIRLGVVERHAGHVTDSLARLSEAAKILEQSGPLVTGRYHHELATTLKDLAIAEGRSDYSEGVKWHFERAVYEFEAVGHHRYAAVVENNYGFLLLNLAQYEEAELHLLHARQLFEGFDDVVRTAQVDDTLARLYLATERPALAELVVERAVAALETTDEEALLAEALTTKGNVFCKMNRPREARGILEGARRIAERCGDTEGAGRALLIMIEEIAHELQDSELNEMAARVRELLQHTQQAATRSRLQSCLSGLTNQK